MECEKCKKIIPNDSKFCVHCGEEIGIEEEKPKKEQQKNQIVPKIISDIRNHIEFMSYELGDNQIEENGVIRFLASNKNHPNLFISYFNSVNALLFVANFSIPKVDSEQKKHRLLEAANRINSELAIISTFSIGTDFNIITFSSWYPDNYSKKDFSNFLEVFQNEISRLSANEGLQEFV